MATSDSKRKDFYGVLELKKDGCTTADIRNAYKKLALKWHPDRCSGHVKQAEEGKKKFQAIQEAYSVLSDSNKRFLYDVGVYNAEDEQDENDSFMVVAVGAWSLYVLELVKIITNSPLRYRSMRTGFILGSRGRGRMVFGMGDFLDEMVSMMAQNKPSENENGATTFKELQDLFDEICQSDFDASDSSSAPWGAGSSSTSSEPPCSNEHYTAANNKRNYSQMSSNAPNDETNPIEGFHIGAGETSRKK